MIETSKDGEKRSASLSVKKIRPAYEQVGEQLRQLLLTGALEPDLKLPNETELSSKFGVSRNTIREALRMLSARSLITTSRGARGGSFVSRPAPNEVSEYLESSLVLLSGRDASSKISLEDLLEARELLESPAARLAAERHTDAQLDSLQACVDTEWYAFEQDKGFEEHRRFHELVVEASGNLLLTIMTRPVFRVVQLRFRREEAPRDFWSLVIQDHERILTQIHKGDGEGAASEMAAHLHRLNATYTKIQRFPVREQDIEAP